MLTLRTLVGRNLIYHWRGNLAVLLGVAVGSAVLTGALLVGDSLRGSLRERAERQIAGIDSVAFFPRPIRASIADGMPGKVAPGLLLPGSIRKLGTPDGPIEPTIGGITVLGVDDRFRPQGAEETTHWAATARPRDGVVPIVFSQRVATRLSVNVGDKIRLGVQRFSDLPRSSSLAKRAADDVTTTILCSVAAILPPDSPGNDFNLTPSPSAPLNVFVPLGILSNLVRDESDRSDAAIANVLFASGASIVDWNAALATKLRPEDYGLQRRIPRNDRYLSVESDQLVISPSLIKAIEQSAGDCGLRAEPTVVYVADTLSQGSHEIPYPIIAGLNASALAPLGPFLPVGVSRIEDNEIVLVDWGAESPFHGLTSGAKMKLLFFNPDVEGDGKLESAELMLRGQIPLSGAARDRDLTPTIRGITDERADLFSWDRPPMLPKEKIRLRVPDNGPRARFWNANKATPMAYLNLATAEKLFAGRSGSVTSVRIAPASGESLDQTKERLDKALARHLDPASAGLSFDPIRERLLTASRGGTDFGGLFLGFSCFLIAAALMLVGLLFRLSLDRRAKELGLLLATGYSHRVVRKLLFLEGIILAALGSAIGLVAALGYNILMLKLLLDLWPSPEVANYLLPHATLLSFAIGFAAITLMSFLSLGLSTRGLLRVTPPALLRGEITVVPVTGPIPSYLSKWILFANLISGIVLIVSGRFISNPDFQAMSFFTGGGLMMIAGLALAWIWMKRARHGVIVRRGAMALVELAIRNAGRNPTRSILIAALLASAAFLLVAVESFRREPGSDFLDRNGGSGGFNLIAQCDIPLYQSFDTGAGRNELERQLAEAFKNDRSEKYQASIKRLIELLASTTSSNANPVVIPLRERGGDDASCLNLFQAARPKLLGVPHTLIERGGFSFYETEVASPEEQKNPWLLLEKPLPDGAMPVFAENNTAVWMLKSGVGGNITMPDDSGVERRFRIVGTFADSPFQSELLLSEANFIKLFPKRDGYQEFLIQTPPGSEREFGHLLEIGLSRNGMIVTPTRDRVAAFQAVIGAYLSTFQLLGGFGLLLGVFGLAVVVLRSVWERIGELALLRCVGYRTRSLHLLVLAENAALLLVGLAVGVFAAMASVLPHLVAGASIPWARLTIMLGLVVATGLVSAAVATAGILRVPLIPALRSE